MPFYDFRCSNCDWTKEIFLVRPQPESVALDCPTCGRRMEKQLSAPAFTIAGFRAANGYSSER
jgi:putative FmdB family regulatory protein